MQTTTLDPVIAVLAGGLGSRMGRDKAQIPWQGQPLLERTVALALTVADSVLVAGRSAPEGWPFPEVPCLTDKTPRLGPIGGLVSALRYASPRPVLLLPTDMPLLTKEAVAWLYGRSVLCAGGADGVAVMNGLQLEPVCSIFAHSALVLAEQALTAGRPSLKAVITSGDFPIAYAPENLRSSFTNVNTPEDLDSLLDMS